MGGGAPVGYRVPPGHQTPFLIDLIVAGVLMSRLLLTDEPPTPYCPHCGQPMKLVGISRLLGRSCRLCSNYIAPPATTKK